MPVQIIHCHPFTTAEHRMLQSCIWCIYTGHFPSLLPSLPQSAVLCSWVGNASPVCFACALLSRTDPQLPASSDGIHWFAQPRCQNRRDPTSEEPAWLRPEEWTCSVPKMVELMSVSWQAWGLSPLLCYLLVLCLCCGCINNYSATSSQCHHGDVAHPPPAVFSWCWREQDVPTFHHQFVALLGAVMPAWHEEMWSPSLCHLGPTSP